jgi:hypothetical protein
MVKMTRTMIFPSSVRAGDIFMIGGRGLIPIPYNNR